MSAKDVITLKEASQRLGVCIHTIRKLVEEGEIISIRISPRRIVIPLKPFENWINERSKTTERASDDGKD